MNTFFDRVRLLAEQNYPTLQEFMLSVGFKRDSYYTLKTKGNFPRADKALKIAKALGTTVEYLIDGTDPAKGAQSLLDTYNGLNETGKQATIGAIKVLCSVFLRRSSHAGIK
jgi:transcriptional regulator with XRE-family HTH domain